MPADFRAELYRGYVSNLSKREPSPVGSQGLFAWWDHKYLPLLDDLDRAAPILEIGCGSGALLAYLERRGFSHALGVDISEEQVRLAQRRGVQAECGDALELLRDRQQQYSAILAIDVLEHFTRDELVQLAGGMYEALVPSGRLIVQTANGAGLFPRQVIYGDLTHLTIFTPESLGQLLRSVGFVDLSFCETGPIPLRLRGRLNAVLWMAIKRAANAIRYVETGKRQSIWTENFICRAFRPGTGDPRCR